MLYSERKRLEKLLKKEAEGVSIWSDEIPAALRVKIDRLINVYGGAVNSYSPNFGSEKLRELAQRVMIADLGVESLYGIRGEGRDFTHFLKNCSSSNFPDVLEAMYIAIRNLAQDNKEEIAKNFEIDTNELLESYRVNYSLESGKVIPFTSKEIFAQVIVPVLRLLSSGDWEKVEKAYQDALKELSDGNPADAITDATTALQEALKKVGCKGSDFASLVKSAKNTIFTKYNSKYISGIENLISWASAMRSEKGDSHKVTDTDKNEAWFVVHTVGVLILQLSKMTKT